MPGFLFCPADAAPTGELNSVPQPKSAIRTKGGFKCNYQTKITATAETGRKSAAVLNDWLVKNYGFKLEYSEKPFGEKRDCFRAAEFGGRTRRRA